MWCYSCSRGVVLEEIEISVSVGVGGPQVRDGIFSEIVQSECLGFRQCAVLKFCESEILARWQLEKWRRIGQKAGCSDGEDRSEVFGLL